MRILPGLLYRPLRPLLPFAVIAVAVAWGGAIARWVSGLPFHAVAQHWNELRLVLLLAVAGGGNLVRLAVRAARHRASASA